MQYQKTFVIFYVILLAFTNSISFSQTNKIQAVPETQFTFEFSETVSVSGNQRHLAVAFHSVTFIDAIGHSLGEVQFGTAEANAKQGIGWYPNETTANPGTFQWAGGAAKKAELQQMLPRGTEGLLFNIMSAQDSLWMEVKIDGKLAATLRVDAYWHQGYVPVSAPVPEPKPVTEPQWTEGRYFPHFPETDRIYAFRIANTFAEDFSSLWNVNWRIQNSHDDMLALTLVSMQGLINRNQPRVYLDWNDRDQHHLFWQQELAKYVEVIPLELDGLSAVNFLMRRYADRFAGAVIYDPDVPETINLATMIAGLENRMILAPQQLGLPGIPNFESIYDLRDLVQQQGWTATIESQTRIYQWVYDNLWPNLEHRILAEISPGPPTSRENNASYWPLGMASRDYMIALRIPALYLDPSFDAAQVQLFSRFLADAPSPIPIDGVHAGNEAGTLQLISSYGDINLAFTWPGEVISFTSLTVFSGVRPPIQPHRAELNPERILATLTGKPAVTLYTTDGDANFYQINRGFYNIFDWPSVKDQRHGWTINAILSEMAPVIWNYYETSRTGACLTSAVNGAGYMNLWDMNATQLRNYLKYAARYLKDSGLRSIHIMGGEESIALPYFEELHDAGYLGSLFGYRENEYRGMGFYYAGAATPTLRAGYLLNSENLDRIVSELTARRPGEEFFDIRKTWNINPDCQYVMDADAIGGGAVFVPKEFVNSPSYSMVFGLDGMIFGPGEYVVTYRLKVAGNIDSAPIAYLFAGKNPADWEGIVSEAITPNSFSQPGLYQEHTMEFTLDNLTTNIRVGLDFGSGATDLYIDWVRIVNKNGSTYPVNTSIVLDNINWRDPALPGVSRQFIGQIEAAGGVVLSPDECLASLNPEYMINLAETMLPPDNPLLVSAKAQFAVKDYFNSLISVRDAIRPLFNPDVTVRFNPPESAVAMSEPCSVHVVIADVTDLGSFQLEIEYDTDVVHADTAFIGALPGSTGRLVTPNGPIIDNSGADGKLSFGATTSGVNPGANGSGILVTIVFQPRQAGETTLLLKNINIGNVSGQNLHVASVQSGRIAVAIPTEAWQRQISGISNNLSYVSAISNEIAWIAGGMNTVLRTTNGGTTWENVWAISDSINIQIVTALNADTALIAGLTTQTNTAAIYKTSNGGASWNKVFEQANGSINNITLFNNRTGIAQGNPVNNRWTLLKTADGGNSWQAMPGAPNATDSQETGSRTGVVWLDSLECWFTGTNYNLYHTTNSGQTWTLVNPGHVKFYNVIAFNHEGCGLAGDFGGNWYLTRDKGVTWREAPLMENKVHIVDLDHHFWILTDNKIYRSSDSGDSWELQATLKGTNHLYFLALSESVGQQFGWVVGEHGFIAKYNNYSLWTVLAVQPNTLDFGLTRTSQKFTLKNTGTEDMIWSASTDAQWIASITPTRGSNYAEVTVTANREHLNPGKYIGFISIETHSGTKRIAVKIAVPGKDWVNPLSQIKNNLYTVSAVSDQVAWASGKDGVVLRTTNGGVLWRDVWQGADSLDILNITALNADTALITAVAGEWHGGQNVGYIYGTADGGSHWSKVFEQENVFFNDLKMFNPLSGMATADPKNDIWQIWKTIDGGQTWLPLSNLPTAEESETGYLHSVYQVDSARGWFGTSTGRVLATTDGGATWNSVKIPDLEKVVALAFGASGVGLAADNAGKLALTMDNGFNWQELPAPEAGFVRGLCAQQDTFWLLIDSTLYRSAENGSNWEFQTIVPANLRDVDWVTTEKGIYGWIAGESGIIQKNVFDFDIPVLAVDATLLDFGNQITEKNFRIQNPGTGALFWEVQINRPWISSVSPAAGSADDTIKVTVDRSQLKHGNYTGKLWITSNGGAAEIILKMAVGDTVNLLLNGDFSADSTGWYLFVHDSAAATARFENETLAISISDSGDAASHLQLRQDHFLIEKGKRYRVEFDAAATGPREIFSEIRQSVAPGTSYSSSQTFTLTPEPQTFKYFFMMTAPTDPAARIVFDLGLSNQDVFLDNILLYEVTADKVEPAESGIPRQFVLLQNYPNPFNPKTIIRFDLPQACHVTLEIYNTNGQRIECLAQQEFQAGGHRIVWNASQIASGIYFYTLRAKAVGAERVDFVATRKLVVVK